MFRLQQSLHLQIDTIEKVKYYIPERIKNEKDEIEMKKFTAVLLICGLLLCFAACGRPSRNNSVVTPQNSNQDPGQDPGQNSNQAPGQNSSQNSGQNSNQNSGQNTEKQDNNKQNNSQNTVVETQDPNVDYVNGIISQVDQLVASQDYSGALNLLDEAKNTLTNKNADQSVIDTIDTKVETVKSKYAAFFVHKAKDAFAEKNADGAVENIKSALELTPDNAEYTALKMEYEKYLPFALYLEENMLSIENHPFYRAEETANNNTVMSNNIMWTPEGSSEEVSATYSLGGNYDIVSGTIFCREKYKNDDYSGYIEVYGDGTLLYTSPEVGKNIIPQNFTCNVTGVQKLTLRFYGTPKSTAYYDAAAFGVSEIVAQKNFP